MSQIINFISFAAKPAKRSKKTKNTSNTETHDDSANSNQRIHAHIKDGSDISQFCRTIDTEVIVMLKDFNLDANEDNENELGLPGLRFVVMRFYCDNVLYVVIF